MFTDNLTRIIPLTEEEINETYRILHNEFSTKNHYVGWDEEIFRILIKLKPEMEQELRGELK